MRIWKLTRLKNGLLELETHGMTYHNTHLQAAGKNKTHLTCLHKRNYQILCFFSRHTFIQNHKT